MTSPTWPGKVFWDELAGKYSNVSSIPEDMTICMQCGAEIGKDATPCPECHGDPVVALSLDLTDFSDDDWEPLR